MNEVTCTRRPYRFLSSFSKYLNSSSVLGLALGTRIEQWAKRVFSRSLPTPWGMWSGSTQETCGASRVDQCGGGKGVQGLPAGMGDGGVVAPAPRPCPLIPQDLCHAYCPPDLQFLLGYTFPPAIANEMFSTHLCLASCVRVLRFLFRVVHRSGSQLWQSCPWEYSGSVLLLAASSRCRFRCGQQP